MSTTTLTTGQLISLTDGRLACSVGDAIKAMNELLDDDLYTHQVPRAGEFLMPKLIAQHPWTEDLPAFKGDPSMTDEQLQAAVDEWLAEISAKHGETHEVTDPSEGWERRNPIDELADKIGVENVYVFPPNEQQQ